MSRAEERPKSRRLTSATGAKEVWGHVRLAPTPSFGSSRFRSGGLRGRRARRRCGGCLEPIDPLDANKPFLAGRRDLTAPSAFLSPIGLRLLLRGRPDKRAFVPVPGTRHVPLSAAVDVHGVDLAVAVAFAHERDLLPVG